MKKQLTLTLFFLVMLAFGSSVFAQSTTDTVYIPGAQSLEISNIINADTSVTDHRVYVLDRGAIYYIEAAFELNSSCTFMATGDENARPPVLAPAIRADNSSEEWFFKLITPGISVELKDLYLLSMRSDGKTLGWSRGVWLGADEVSLKLRNVVFDAFTEAGIKAESKLFKLDVQDCHFRNILHSTSYFGGQPFLSNVAPTDTVKFINNTFFACNSYLFSVRGLGPKSVFEHNSVIYGAVNPFLIRQADNLYIKNNLFYASHAWGGDPDQTINGWFFNYPDTVSTSIYRIRKNMVYNGLEVTGPEAYNDTALGLIFDANTWTNVAENNVYHFPSDLVDYYNDWNDTVTVSDSVTVVSGPKLLLKRTLNMPRWISDCALAVLDTVTDPESAEYSPNVSVANNVDADPQFVDNATAGHLSELIGYVDRIASRQLDNPWHYELNFPPTWPLPENLEYSNETLKSFGSDGFPVGDLNWFPDVKDQWLTGVEQTSAEVPNEFELSDNYPNPFNPTTKINFSIPESGLVSLKVYNLLGQEVRSLVNEELNAGSYTFDFDASHLSSGVYFYTLNSKDFSLTKKMMLLK